MEVKKPRENIYTFHDACRACAQSMGRKYDNKYLNITGKTKNSKLLNYLNIMSEI